MELVESSQGERLLAPNFSGAETFRISFPTNLKPDYYPQ